MGAVVAGARADEAVGVGVDAGAAVVAEGGFEFLALGPDDVAIGAVFGAGDDVTGGVGEGNF